MRTRAATFSSWLGLQLPVPASSDYFLLYFLRYVSSATDVVPWQPKDCRWRRFCGLQWKRKIAICPSYLADDWVTITTYLTLDWGVFKKVEVAASSKSCKVLHGSATQQHQLPPHICCCLKIQIWTLFFWRWIASKHWAELSTWHKDGCFEITSHKTCTVACSIVDTNPALIFPSICHLFSWLLIKICFFFFTFLLFPDGRLNTWRIRGDRRGGHEGKAERGAGRCHRIPWGAENIFFHDC